MKDKGTILNKISSLLKKKIDYTSVMGYELPELNALELEYILNIIECEILKDENEHPSELYGNLLLVYGINIIDNTVINGINVKDLSTKSLYYLSELLFAIKLRTEEKIKIVEDEYTLINPEFIRLDFNYIPQLVDGVRALNTSDYKSKILKDELGKPIKITRGKNKGKPKKETWWVVHISELPELKEIFRYTQIDCEKAYILWRNKMISNKLVINNQHGYLYGFNLPYEEIDYACSLPIKGSEFSSAVKDGFSDGRDHLFERGTRKFPRGLLNKIVAILDKKKTKYIFEDNRTQYKKEFDWNYNGKYSPRDYQKEGLERILKHRMGILQLATGAGKTILAGYATSQIGVKTIFFVHTKFLLKQAKEAFEEAIGGEIGQIGDGVVDIRSITIAMVQTVIRAYGDDYDKTVDNEDEDVTDDTDISGYEEDIRAFIESEVDLVYFDECQFVGADTFYKIANKCNAVYKIGLSATPYRSDGKDMKIKAALGEVIYKINASYLIKRGILLKPLIKFIQIGRSSYNEKRRYNSIYKEEIVENVERNKIIISQALGLMEKGKSVLLLVQQIKHGEILQKMFKELGHDIDFTAGKIDPKAEQRSEKVEKLYRKEKMALIASTIADEGLDIQTLDGLILCGGGKSPSKAMQRVGRALRKIDVIKLTNIFKKEGKNVLVVAQNEEEVLRLTNMYKERLVPINTVLDTPCDKEYLLKENGVIVVTTPDISLTYKKDKIDVVFATNGNNFGWLDIEEHFSNINYKFVDKDFAYIVDFIDNKKYLFSHSEERRDMFLTEEEFVIYGWGKEYRVSNKTG